MAEVSHLTPKGVLCSPDAGGRKGPRERLGAWHLDRPDQAGTLQAAANAARSNAQQAQDGVFVAPRKQREERNCQVDFLIPTLLGCLADER